MIKYITTLIRNQQQNQKYMAVLSSISEDLSSTSNITITSLQPENLEIDLPNNIKFYQLHNNKKYLTESEHHAHLDKTYGNKDIEKSEIHKTLKYLFIEFKKWIEKDINGTILWWLEYGSLLGSFREKNIIKWDDDGDIGIFCNDLLKLPIKYETDKWIWSRNKHINKHIYDSRNTVSARFVSKINGVFIDFFSYSIIDAIDNNDGNNKNKKYVYNSFSMNNFNLWQLYDDLMPLNNSAIFLNQTEIMFNKPRDTKKWLLNEYSSLEPPMEKVWQYEDHNFSFGDYDNYEWYNQYQNYPI